MENSPLQNQLWLQINYFGLIKANKSIIRNLIPNSSDQQNAIPVQSISKQLELRVSKFGIVCKSSRGQIFEVYAIEGYFMIEMRKSEKGLIIFWQMLLVWSSSQYQILRWKILNHGISQRFQAESGEIRNTQGLNSLTNLKLYRIKEVRLTRLQYLISKKFLQQFLVPKEQSRIQGLLELCNNRRIIISNNSLNTEEVRIIREYNNFQQVKITLRQNPSQQDIKPSLRQNLVQKQKCYKDYVIQLNLISKVEDRQLKIKFDKLLIATGSKAKVMHKRALRYENVFTLRNYADNQKFMQKLKDSQSISIIGGSFIGLETASSIKRWFPDKKVTVFEFQDKPLARVFGNEIAQQIVESHINKGIEIITGCLVKNFKGSENQLRELGYYLKADLNTKLKKKTDMCLLATGAELNTKIVPKQLLDEKDNSILVSSKLQTSHPDIFAAGDIAKFDSLLSQRKQRIEHWAVAGDQGIIAARNMLGQQKDYNYVPYFWTFQWFKAEYVGFPGDEHYCETLSNQGDNSARIAYIFKDQKVVGCAVVNVPLAAIKLNIGLENNLFPSKEEIVSGRFKFNDLVEKVSKL